ncbi:hypothetical protein ABPG75_012292 [Micractinium tetrahymenae]
MRRAALLRALQLRAAAAAPGALESSVAAQGAPLGASLLAATLAALPAAANPALSTLGSSSGPQQQRGISAAAILLSEAGKAGAGGGSGGSSGSSTAPPEATAAAPPADEPEGAMYGSEDEEDEEAEAAMAEAFERLIQAAFEMVQQGKPMEADYVLTEGAKQAAEILGPDALELAALYDQLCIIRFLHERMEEAGEAAKQALDILKRHDDGFGPATAIAATRYASTLLATGSPQEAQLYSARSIDSLEKAMGMMAEIQPEDDEDEAELADTREKFEMGLGESRFYHGLAKQAQNLTPAAVGQHMDEMRQGLQAMAQHLGPDSPLIAAALREHSRLIMSALEQDQLELAEALYMQDAKLHMAVGSNFEHVALTLYQCGTLQYVMGKYATAADSLKMSLQTVRKHYPQAEEHMLTVQQRLGMVLAMLGKHEQAREMLHDVAPALMGNLGEGNPASEELEFMLALIGLKEMEADGVTDAARRQQLLSAMEEHLAKLSAYGDEHMLVKKAQQLHAEAVGSGGAT